MRIAQRRADNGRKLLRVVQYIKCRFALYMMAYSYLARHYIGQRIDEQRRTGIILAVRDGSRVVGVILDTRATIGQYHRIHTLGVFPVTLFSQ